MSHMRPKILRPLPADNHSFSEHGQSIVIITLVMVGVIAMLGLVLDGGNAYLQRRRMQNAADAAALAGAIEMAEAVPPGEYPAQTEARILRRINTLAESNGVIDPNPPAGDTNNSNVVAYFIDSSGSPIGLIGVQGGVPSNAKGVQVTTATSFSTFFLNVVNEPVGAAKAQAKAAFAPIQTPWNIAPLAAPCKDRPLDECFTSWNRYDIYEGLGPSNFGWLSWNGDTNAGYVQNELNPEMITLDGYVDPHGVCPNGHIGENCWVQGLTGIDSSSSNRTELDKWIARSLPCLNDPSDPTCNPIIIIIYDQCEPLDPHDPTQCKDSGGGAGANYHIAGFAAFIVEGYSLSGKWISGRFIEFVTPGDLCTNCDDGGLRGVHLRP